MPDPRVEQSEQFLPIPNTDDQFFAQLRTAQQQELELARINAERDTELAQIRRQERRDRREWLGGLLGGVAIFVVIMVFLVGLGFGLAGAGQSEQDKVREAEIAKVCIEQGKEWIRGSCRD